MHETPTQNPPKHPPAARPLHLVSRPMQQESTPQRVEDRFTRQAEATLLAIAEDRRRADALQKERNDLFDANAKAYAQIDLLRDELRKKDEDIAHQKALVDSWHGEAMRMRSIIDLTMGTMAQAMGSDVAGEGEGNGG